MEMFKSVNLLVRFLLELCILAILGYWGTTVGQQTLTKVGLGLGAPILSAVTWGVFLAPASAGRLHEPWLFVVEVAIFGLTAWALASTGKPSLAFTFSLIYMLNKLLLIFWRQ